MHVGQLGGAHSQQLHGALAGGSQPDMAVRADVIVSEIFDSELLGEGLLPSLRDACSRLLAPGGVVIPARAVIWGQLVQSTHLHRCTVRALCSRGGRWKLREAIGSAAFLPRTLNQ